MTKSLTRLLELAGVAKGPTIADATQADGEINRKTSDAILDPKGYFKANKDRNFGGKSVNEAEKQDLGIQNPNSSGQGFHPDHANHPFHDILKKHQYRYSHSTPIRGSNGEDYLHHTYSHLDLRDNKVGISPPRDMPSGRINYHSWEAGKPQSGRKTHGFSPERLDRFLKGHVKRAIPKD